MLAIQGLAPRGEVGGERDALPLLGGVVLGLASITFGRILCHFSRP